MGTHVMTMTLYRRDCYAIIKLLETWIALSLAPVCRNCSV